MTPIERVGRYRLDGVLGVGSFATVYRARDERLDADVVVKILAENHTLNPEIRERFIAEGRSLRKVDNPHVVTVHDMGETDRQQPYLVLEYADRGTLGERVEHLRASGWRPGREDVLRVARDLTSALMSVHKADLVHRDLSPRNVLLKASSEPAVSGAAASQVVGHAELLVVADLGMCKDLAVNSGLTVAGGTAGFRPPEQEAGPALIDHRADLWAMSRLLAWVAEGGDFPRAFHAVVERSLSRDPRRRHPDATAWLADIEGSLAEPSEPAPAQHTPERPRLPWRAALATLALAAAFAAGALLPGWLTSVATGGNSFSIEGPSRISVGETAVYRAEVGDATSWVWILPSGRYLADEPEVELTPRTPGTAEVTIQGQDATGRTIEVTKDIKVG